MPFSSIDDVPFYTHLIEHDEDKTEESQVKDLTNN